MLEEVGVQPQNAGGGWSPATECWRRLESSHRMLEMVGVQPQIARGGRSRATECRRRLDFSHRMLEEVKDREKRSYRHRHDGGSPTSQLQNRTAPPAAIAPVHAPFCGGDCLEGAAAATATNATAAAAAVCQARPVLDVPSQGPARCAALRVAWGAPHGVGGDLA
eukprot:365400-Chlamydomonas_euryale.AAC.7